MVTKLEITIDQNGNVQVQGPIENKIICYAMLELARDTIKDYNDKQGESSIAVVGSIPSQRM